MKWFVAIRIAQEV